MSIGVSCLKRFHHAEFGGNREDQEGEERSRPSGKRAKYMYEHASSFIAESVSPPPPPSYHFRRSSTSASPCPHVYNSCYDRSQDRVDDMQEGEEEQNNSLILTATAVPSKRYINEYFELGARRSYGTSSAMEQDLAGAASGGGSVSPVCESCSAVLEEDDLMQEQGGGTACYFCSKRGCRHCVERCLACKDRFCSNCSIAVYSSSYSHSDERICIDCNCENPTTYLR